LFFQSRQSTIQNNLRPPFSINIGDEKDNFLLYDEEKQNSSEAKSELPPGLMSETILKNYFVNSNLTFDASNKQS